jgi:hypothetical protein
MPVIQVSVSFLACSGIKERPEEVVRALSAAVAAAASYSTPTPRTSSPDTAGSPVAALLGAHAGALAAGLLAPQAAAPGPPPAGPPACRNELLQLIAAVESQAQALQVGWWDVQLKLEMRFLLLALVECATCVPCIRVRRRRGCWARRGRPGRRGSTARRHTPPACFAARWRRNLRPSPESLALSMPGARLQLPFFFSTEMSRHL